MLELLSLEITLLQGFEVWERRLENTFLDLCSDEGKPPMLFWNITTRVFYYLEKQILLLCRWFWFQNCAENTKKHINTHTYNLRMIIFFFWGLGSQSFFCGRRSAENYFLGPVVLEWKLLSKSPSSSSSSSSSSSWVWLLACGWP